MTAINLPLPESPELNNDITIESIRLIFIEKLPNLSPIKSNEIVFCIATLIGFKDLQWDNHFKQLYKTH